MSEKEQQFERIYKETENFGRTQFVREIQMQINDNKRKDKEIERLNKELEFEKATNKELISTGADLENKLYEEQDKNKRLNNIINKLEIILQQDLECEKDVYWTNITKEDYIQFMLKKIQELKGEDK